MSLIIPSCVCVAGAATHLLYLHRSEHHMHAIRYLQLLVLVPSTYIILTTVIYSASVIATSLDALTLLIIYLSGLYTSLITYCVLLSPLRFFPGPFGSRVSSLYLSIHLARLTAHTKLLSLHDTYGFFVRIGSSDLSITHSIAV